MSKFKNTLIKNLRKNILQNLKEDVTPPTLGPGLVRIGDDPAYQYGQENPGMSNPYWHPASPYYGQDPLNPIWNPFPSQTRPNWYPSPFAPNYGKPGLNWIDLYADWAQRYFEKYGRWPRGYNPARIPGSA